MSRKYNWQISVVFTALSKEIFVSRIWKIIKYIVRVGGYLLGLY